MKIAFLVFPEIKLIDLLLAAEPLQTLQKLGLNPRDLQVDYVAQAPLPNGLDAALASSLITTKVSASLTEYDIVVLPGKQTAALKTWISSMHLEAVVLTCANRAETFFLSLKLCELVAGKQAKQKVADSLGLPAEMGDNTLVTLREASLTRKTKETSINLSLNLDGSGKHKISTGIPFFDHMLTQIAVHGLFDLIVHAKGDLEIDPHHTVEDVALALGKAFDQALGDRKGLVRMASATVPMDESLAQVSLDFSGRPYTMVDASFQDLKIGDLPVTLITHFLESFAVQARCNLSVRLITGGDDHHRAEAIFKAFARALDEATRLDPRRSGAVPSSKGVL
jgi:imidazoleglycerol-phosphate dehydratase